MEQTATILAYELPFGYEALFAAMSLLFGVYISVRQYWLSRRLEALENSIALIASEFIGEDGEKIGFLDAHRKYRYKLLVSNYGRIPRVAKTVRVFANESKSSFYRDDEAFIIGADNGINPVAIYLKIDQDYISSEKLKVEIDYVGGDKKVWTSVSILSHRINHWSVRTLSK